MHPSIPKAIHNDLKKNKVGNYYSGLSGLQLNIPKYLFPPPFENSSRLTYYASLFNSIEVNSSFYKIPQPGTLARWVTSVGTNFKFTFKLWREITHVQHLDYKAADVLQFLSVIKSAEEKLGCLLIQLPPKASQVSIPKLNSLLQSIREKEPSWNLAVEFRNASWYNATTYELLNTYNTALVIQDMPSTATPLIDETIPFKYIRFHGPEGNYRGSYTNEFLSEYAIYIVDWQSEGKEVYLYFNNTAGEAFQNLQTLNDLVRHFHT